MANSCRGEQTAPERESKGTQPEGDQTGHWTPSLPRSSPLSTWFASEREPEMCGTTAAASRCGVACTAIVKEAMQHDGQDVDRCRERFTYQMLPVHVCQLARMGSVMIIHARSSGSTAGERALPSAVCGCLAPGAVLAHTLAEVLYYAAWWKKRPPELKGPRDVQVTGRCRTPAWQRAGKGHNSNITAARPQIHAKYDTRSYGRHYMGSLPSETSKNVLDLKFPTLKPHNSPGGKNMIELSLTQDEEGRNGSTSVIVLAHDAGVRMVGIKLYTACYTGETEDSCILSGVKLDKDIVHSRMRRRILKPRIMFLDSPGKMLARSVVQLERDIRSIVIISAYKKTSQSALEIVSRMSVQSDTSDDARRRCSH
ncbi:hypothetical protein BC827DRAFT_1158586 [Russula dissimulans]|nr:hypothetical protein BC827DRAFT_1158586 [Russula dissimulans]